MRRFFLPVLLFACTVASAQVAKVPDSHSDIKFPPLNPIKIPTVDRSVLPNGMVLYLVQDKELPLVKAQAMIRTGERWEPIEKAGLAGIAARVMRTGGTPSRNGDDLDRELDRLGASVETFSGEDSSGASVFVLKEDAQKGLDILADVLRNPAFPQDKIDLIKTNLRAGIARRNDQAHGIHARETLRLLYGKTSPYTRQTEYATLDAITRDDLTAFHKQYFHPENVILGVWGDFDPAAMKALVAKSFGIWPKGAGAKPAVPPVDVSVQARGLHLLEKDDVNQSTIGISLLMGKRNDPDYHALVVMTEILGGGFSSRLFNVVRTNAGLAYRATAHYAAEYDHAGYWEATTSTKSETTAQAYELVRSEIGKIRKEPVTADELQRAKDSILKGEAFDYDSTGKIAGRLMSYEYYGYPADFLKQFRAGIDRVTIADVQRVAQKHLDEDRFLTVVLGNSSKFDKPLDTFGKVAKVDYSIPGPKAAPVAAATSETRDKGKTLMARAKAAHGGAAIDQLKDYSLKLDMTRVTPQGEMAMQVEAVSSLSGKMLMKLVLPVGEILQGFNGEKIWMRSPQGIQEMGGAMAERARQSSMREILPLLQSFDKEGWTVQALGTSKLDGKDVEGVMLANAANKVEVKLFIDPATGLLAGKSYMDPGGMGSAPGERLETFSDTREVSGIKVPFRILVTAGGQKSSEQTTKEAKFNTGVADSVFEKPAQ